MSYDRSRHKHQLQCELSNRGSEIMQRRCDFVVPARINRNEQRWKVEKAESSIDVHHVQRIYMQSVE